MTEIEQTMFDRAGTLERRFTELNSKKINHLLVINPRIVAVPQDDIQGLLFFLEDLRFWLEHSQADGVALE